MRHIQLFNNDWKFHQGEATGVDSADFNDSGWRPVTLPHDWSIEGSFDSQWASATGYLPGGVGWYRKTFSQAEVVGRVSLRFDGVYCNSDVWVNGHHLGHRPNGFISFQYDVTPYLKAVGTNILAVRVDHTRFADARWYTGSGINRNVSLIATDSIHIRPWGVFATTPIVTEAQAEVHVEVRLENHADAPASVQVTLALLDAHGATVAEASETVDIPAHGEQAAVGQLTVPRPRLWSVGQPELYTLRTRILRDGQVLDLEETPIGIRSFRFDPNEGFFLNGQSLKMQGVCLHDDAGALGTAVPPKVWERRLQILKAAGVNAIRMAHNPHMPELYDLCDRLGFLVQDEAFDEWELGKNKWIAGWNVGQPGKDGPSGHFAEWAEADLRDMILRDRNHPSIIMWSIGNEIDYPNDPYTHEVLEAGTNPQSYGRGFHTERPHADRLGVVARRLVEVAKQYDATRPVTAALAAALISNVVGFSDALDVVGYNYQEYRYAEDHAQFPNHVLYGSENGMRWGFWQAVADHPYISGQFLWTGIDYLGEAHGWPDRSNGAGLLDLAGLPKPEYFFRQSLWTDAPMVYLGTRDVPQGEEAENLWRHQKAEPVWRGESGRMVRVLCFTNCDGAELFLNGRSLGVKSVADAEEHTLWWDVSYQPGTLAVRGLKSGATVASGELQTSGPPRRLVAESDAAVLTADGVDLAHVIVTVVDAAGIAVYDADHEVSWAIEGPARLLGLESGDHASHKDYQADRRRLFHGRLLGYIQATHTPGLVTIHLSAPGLQDAAVTLRTERPDTA